MVIKNWLEDGEKEEVVIKSDNEEKVIEPEPEPEKIPDNYTDFLATRNKKLKIYHKCSYCGGDYKKKDSTANNKDEFCDKHCEKAHYEDKLKLKTYDSDLSWLWKAGLGFIMLGIVIYIGFNVVGQVKTGIQAVNNTTISPQNYVLLNAVLDYWWLIVIPLIIMMIYNYRENVI